MTPILRVDRTSQQLHLGIDRGCQAARLSGATLTLWRAGIAEADQTPVVYTATTVTADWLAIFDLDATWLDQPDGRWTGRLETACGAALIQFQKGGVVRLGPRSTTEAICGDVGATCADVCDTGTLTLPSYTGVWRIVGHGTVADGILSEQTNLYNVPWQVVTAPADTATTFFQQWSDGVLTRARSDGAATANIDVTAEYLLGFTGRVVAVNDSTVYENLLDVNGTIYWNYLTADNRLGRVTDRLATATPPAKGNLTDFTTGWINNKPAWVFDGTYVWSRNAAGGIRRWDPVALTETTYSFPTGFSAMIVSPTNEVWIGTTSTNMGRMNKAAPSSTMLENRTLSFSPSSILFLPDDTLVAGRELGGVQVSFFPAGGPEQVVTLTGGSSTAIWEVLHNATANTIMVFGDNRNDLWLLNVVTKAFTYVSLASAAFTTTESYVRRYDAVRDMLWVVAIESFGTPVTRILGFAGATGAKVYDSVVAGANLTGVFNEYAVVNAVRARHVLTAEREWMFTARHSALESWKGVIFAIQLP